MTEQRDRAVAALGRTWSVSPSQMLANLDANPEAAAALRAYLGVDVERLARAIDNHFDSCLRSHRDPDGVMELAESLWHGLADPKGATE